MKPLKKGGKGAWRKERPKNTSLLGEMLGIGEKWGQFGKGKLQFRERFSVGRREKEGSHPIGAAIRILHKNGKGYRETFKIAR